MLFCAMLAVPGAPPVTPLNLTLYRVTPKNVLGDIANLNTGDAVCARVPEY